MPGAMPPRLAFDPISEARRQWEDHWGDEAVPPMVAVTSIMRVEQLLLARLNALLKPWELTFSRYEALMLLYYSRRGSLPLGKMGDRLQVHRASVTNVIDRLEAQGLVRRLQHETRPARGARGDHRRAAARSPRRRRARSTPSASGPRRSTTTEAQKLFDLLLPMRVEAGDF